MFGKQIGILKHPGYNGKSDAPPAPDYAAAANATAAGNLETAKYTTQANRVNQITPYGNLTYSMTPTFDQAAYDKAMNQYNADLADYNQQLKNYNAQPTGGYGIMGYQNYNRGSAPTAPVMPTKEAYNTGGETWTATQTLSPAQQEILNRQNQLSSGLLGTAQSGLNYAQGVLSKPGVDLSSLTKMQTELSPQDLASSYNVERASGNVYNPDVQRGVNLAGQPSLTSEISPAGGIERSINTRGLPSTGINPGETYSDAIMRRLAPTQQRQTAQLETQLMNQGIAPGTEAWNNAKTQQAQEQNDQLTSAIIGGMQTGLQANQQQFGQNAAQQAAINAAQNQLFGQNAQQAALQNAANAQAYNQALGLGQFANQAAGQQFQQGLSAQALANQAAAQNTGNAANLAALQNQAAAQRLQQQLSSANLANAAQQQQFQQAAYNQMQPINVINAIRTGTQVQNPNYVNSANMPNVGGADLLGAAQNTYNAQLAATNAQNAQSAGFLGGLMNLGGLYGASQGWFKP